MIKIENNIQLGLERVKMHKTKIMKNYAKKTKKKNEKKCCSHTGNRTRATAVRAPDPNHQTIWDLTKMQEKIQLNQHFHDCVHHPVNHLGKNLLTLLLMLHESNSSHQKEKICFFVPALASQYILLCTLMSQDLLRLAYGFDTRPELDSPEFQRPPSNLIKNDEKS